MQNDRQRCKIKVGSFFSISYGVLELWRKTLGGVDSAPPPVRIGLRPHFKVSVQPEGVEFQG